MLEVIVGNWNFLFYLLVAAALVWLYAVEPWLRREQERREQIETRLGSIVRPRRIL